MELKFRAWHIATEEWLSDAELYQYITIIGGEIIVPTNVKLMQYTGVKASNGQEIYEGYILTNGDVNIKYVVEWIHCSLTARQISNKSTIGLEHWKDGLDVIGNIWENPELLK